MGAGVGAVVNAGPHVKGMETQDNNVLVDVNEYQFILKLCRYSSFSYFARQT